MDLEKSEDIPKQTGQKCKNLTESQQTLLVSLQQCYPEDWKRLLPDFQIDAAKHSDIDIVLRGFKNVIKCGRQVSQKVKKYESEIIEHFSLNSIDELTIGQFERAIFKWPEIDTEFVSNNFKSYGLDSPLIYNNLYEYGWQNSKLCIDDKMFYLKFYDLLMIDIDKKPTKVATENTEMAKDHYKIVESFCQRYPNFLFSVWETVNGVHYILLSHAIPYYRKEAQQLMSSLQCDQWYVIFSGRYGFKYRLTPKIRYDLNGDGNSTQTIDSFVAKYRGTVGTGQPHPKCQLMHQIYIQYLQQSNHLMIPVKKTCTFYDSFIGKIIYRNRNEIFKTPLATDKCDVVILPEDVNENIYSALKKPQMLIEGQEDYYIALDQKTHTFYIAYRDLCIIDLDIHKLDADELRNIQLNPHSDANSLHQQSGVAQDVNISNKQSLEDSVTTPEPDVVHKFDVYQWCHNHFSHKQSAIQIYRSLHGYHLFLVDTPRPHDQLERVSYMRDHGSDFYYAVFSYLRGYCVRLNKKQYREELDPIYQYCGFWGKRKNINKRLDYLTQLHFDQMKKFQDERPCLMR